MMMEGMFCSVLFIIATEEITYRIVSYYSNVDEVEMNLEVLKRNEKIKLKLHLNDVNYCGIFWKLQLLILNKRKNIHCFKISNNFNNNHSTWRVLITLPNSF